MSALRALAEGEATAAYQGLAARRGGRGRSHGSIFNHCCFSPTVSLPPHRVFWP